ncbi:MAG TPA: hypothetical protein VLB68_22110, partial [Pyrinomonadaceae bacterium]|nr:hypothetical protein [Pyrinomonadaceae bacterium]
FSPPYLLPEENELHIHSFGQTSFFLGWSIPVFWATCLSSSAPHSRSTLVFKCPAFTRDKAPVTLWVDQGVDALSLNCTPNRSQFNFDDEGFLLTFSAVVLGPSLSRSSLQIDHFKHNMQRMHTHFC